MNRPLFLVFILIAMAGTTGCFTVADDCAASRTCPDDGNDAGLASEVATSAWNDATDGGVLPEVETSTWHDATDGNSNPTVDAAPEASDASTDVDAGTDVQTERGAPQPGLDADGSDSSPDSVAPAFDASPDAGTGGSVLDASVDAVTCGGSICSGACSNLSTDANNCGVCGRSCGGGSCTNGVCDPWLVVAPFASDSKMSFEYASIGSAFTLGFDGTTVAWASQVPAAPAPTDRVSAANIFSGRTITLYPDSNGQAVHDVGVANGMVAWNTFAASGGIALLFSPSSSASITTIAALSQAGYYGLAVDSLGSRAYTVDFALGTFFTSVCPITQSSLCKMYTLDASLSNDVGGAIALSAGPTPGYLFWLASSSRSLPMGSPYPTLHEFNLATFVDDVLVTFNAAAGPEPGYLVSDGQYVYWLDLVDSPYSIRRIPEGQPGVPSVFQTLPTGDFSTADGIASDSQYVYFDTVNALGQWSVDYMPSAGDGMPKHVITRAVNTWIGSVRAAGGYVVWLETPCLNCGMAQAQLWAIRRP